MVADEWPGWRGGALIGYPNEAEDADVLGPFAQAFHAAIDPDVRLRDAEGAVVPEVVHYHYERAGRHFVFLTNTSREEPREFTLTLRLTGGVELWDPRDGSMEPASIVRGEAGHTHLPVRLEPTGSILICVDPAVECPATPVIAADLPILSVGEREIVGLASSAGKHSVPLGAHECEPRVLTATVRGIPQLWSARRVGFATAKPNALPLSRWDTTWTTG